MKFSLPERVYQNEYTWHEWFAWWPVRIHTLNDDPFDKPNKFVWLEKVLKRRFMFYGKPFDQTTKWVYSQEEILRGTTIGNFKDIKIREMKKL